MLRFRNYSIRQKLTWMNMLVSGAALLLACTAFAAYELADFRLTLVRGLSIQAQIVGANSASALLFNDPEFGEEHLVRPESRSQHPVRQLSTRLQATYSRLTRGTAAAEYRPCLRCERANWKCTGSPPTS